MLDRRQFITSVGLSTLASQATTAKTGNGIEISGTTGAEVVQGGCLLNLQRAYQVMDEENLDALIVTRPINFYHFTGYYDHLAVRMDSPSSFAILSRDEKRPSSVVMNQFIYYYSVADSNFKWDSTVNLFTGWGDKIATAESRDQTEARREVLAPFVFSSKNTLLDRDFEKARINALNRALEGNPSSGNASAALIRAMKHFCLLYTSDAADE